MGKEFVPKDFNVPVTLETNFYLLEKLTPSIGEMDYEAVISSKKRLRTIFGENTEWPRDELTLSDNINDLKRHEREFEAREAFAYTVLELSGKRCIGCVYIEPSTKSTYDCEVYLWIRESDLELDKDLYDNVKKWMKNSWEFKNVAFPGREITWNEWNKIG